MESSSPPKERVEEELLLSTSNSNAVVAVSSSVDDSNNSNRYADVFPIEIECWCFGIANFPGELYPKLIYRVIKEMSPTFRAAIDNGFVFDVFDTARRIFQCSRGVVAEKHIVYSVLANLPMPFELEEESQFVLAQIIDQAEKVYGNVVEQMEQIWKKERLKRKIN